MGRSGIEMAHYVINYCIEQHSPVSNLKLQKLLYYIQAAFLVKGKEAFSDDIAAWKYGPVVEAVYHEYKTYVNHCIDDFAEDPRLDDSDAKLANEVIDSYKTYSALQMVAKTHDEAPWKNAAAHDYSYIKKADIKEFYGRDEGRKIYG